MFQVYFSCSSVCRLQNYVSFDVCPCYQDISSPSVIAVVLYLLRLLLWNLHYILILMFTCEIFCLLPFRSLKEVLTERFQENVPKFQISGWRIRMTMGCFFIMMAVLSVIVSLFPTSAAQPLHYRHYGQPPVWYWAPASCPLFFPALQSHFMSWYWKDSQAFECWPLVLKNWPITYHFSFQTFSLFFYQDQNTVEQCIFSVPVSEREKVKVLWYACCRQHAKSLILAITFTLLQQMFMEFQESHW